MTTLNTAAMQLARLALAALSPTDRAALLAESAVSAEKVLTRREVAARFRRSARTIDVWAARGLLRKVKLPGSSRAVGFREADINPLISGRQAQ